MDQIDALTLLFGFGVFVARIADVSIGTMRTISIVHGRTVAAFFLGIVEVSLWLFVITAVLHRVREQPILGGFYAVGFAAGGVVGIKMERWLAIGNVVVRLISHKHGMLIADALRDHGYGVTSFEGWGRSGPVIELYIVCRRSDLRRLLTLAYDYDPDVFAITEPVGSVNKYHGPLHHPWTGWRAAFKKK